MRLERLIEGLPLRLLSGSMEAEARGLKDDSRRVEAGDLFIARRGSEDDGHKYVRDALSRGAVAALEVTGEAGALESSLAILAKRFHGDPGSKLKLIGITGTNGKTTTAYLVRHLLNSRGHKCGMIGTVEVDDGSNPQPADLTTPGVLELYGGLARMVRNGCDACVMEVSSHALAQGRVEGLRFDAAVFTNLTGDHLDYHKTMEGYAAAKARLFAGLEPSATAVVNGDDPASVRMLRDCKAMRLRFGEAQGVECPVRVDESTARGTRCSLGGPWGQVQANLSQIGRHNAGNSAAALTAVHALGIDVRELVGPLESFTGAPGRLERVPGGEGFEVFVDYAHTDDALANVLRALRPITRGRLRVLFGCGGDRDRTKRPRMARVACDLADGVMITSDNPRTEEPRAIIDQILSGVPDSRRDSVSVEVDRETAIERVIREAEREDVILLAGKGHEDYQIVGTVKRPFDDRLVAKRVLRSMQTHTVGR